MTESLTPPPAEAPSPAPSILSRPHEMPLIIYILYLAHFVPVIGWVSCIVGVVLAYVERDGAAEWLKSHYTFQIRTFWIGLLYASISVVLCFVLIGIPLLIATWIWFVVRCALGLSRLMRNEAYPNPESWTV
ncbi:MAG: DUF4870 domain-containing protein [Caulobacteraceae bacterium]